MAGAVARGAVEYRAVTLGSMPALVTEAEPELAIVTGVRRGGGLAFTENVGYADTLVGAARRVVVQVVEDGAPAIDGEVIAVVGGARPPIPPPARQPGPVERRIGELVAGIVPSGATVQYGIGGVPEAVLGALTTPVSVVSGLVNDALVVLDDRGLLVGDVAASYVWGERTRDLLRSGRIRPIGIRELQERYNPAHLDRFVSINTALQVGLDGSVNIERVGTRLVAGLGGHPDYCAAAARSPGGCSVIALASTHRGRSSIVPVPQVVSTPRHDVQVVVTEHGVADLRGLTDDERQRAMIAIADPDHRAGLERTLSC
jgi:acyl-CoA hydrolase